MKTIFFTIADENNLKWANDMIKSLRYFMPDAETYICTGDDLLERLRKDKKFFYRATPIIAKELFEKGYDCVVKMDADQVVLGDLTTAINTECDVATVYNWNQYDEAVYGAVELPGITKFHYYNNGMVVMKNKKFVDKWCQLVMNEQSFETMPMREQGFLNCLCHFGEYSVVCLDDEDIKKDYVAVHGLASKSMWMDARVVDDKVMIGRAEVKVLHWAGGNEGDKMNYRIRFKDDVIEYIDRVLA